MLRRVVAGCPPDARRSAEAARRPERADGRRVAAAVRHRVRTGRCASGIRRHMRLGPPPNCARANPQIMRVEGRRERTAVRASHGRSEEMGTGATGAGVEERRLAATGADAKGGRACRLGATRRISLPPRVPAAARSLRYEARAPSSCRFARSSRSADRAGRPRRARRCGEAPRTGRTAAARLPRRAGARRPAGRRAGTSPRVKLRAPLLDRGHAGPAFQRAPGRYAAHGGERSDAGTSSETSRIVGDAGDGLWNQGCLTRTARV
ncbi:MAG: hypothetical protein QOC68_4214 [Solirubrobacteraceae bacterium]|nr:hypothetical protein [Solirubrobacteraceae bacterium]